MPTQYDDVDALCPFYQGGSKKKIVCEGITDKCKTIIAFADEKARDIQREVFCNHKYQNCELYRLLEGKYAQDDEVS